MERRRRCLPLWPQRRHLSILVYDHKVCHPVLLLSSLVVLLSPSPRTVSYHPSMADEIRWSLSLIVMISLKFTMPFRLQVENGLPCFLLTTRTAPSWPPAERDVACMCLERPAVGTKFAENGNGTTRPTLAAQGALPS